MVNTMTGATCKPDEGVVVSTLQPIAGPRGFALFSVKEREQREASCVTHRLGTSAGARYSIAPREILNWFHEGSSRRLPHRSDSAVSRAGRLLLGRRQVELSQVA